MKDLGTILQLSSTSTTRADEREYAGRALAWLAGKGIMHDDA